MYNVYNYAFSVYSLYLIIDYRHCSELPLLVVGFTRRLKWWKPGKLKSCKFYRRAVILPSLMICFSYRHFEDSMAVCVLDTSLD